MDSPVYELNAPSFLVCPTYLPLSTMKSVQSSRWNSPASRGVFGLVESDHARPDKLIMAKGTCRECAATVQRNAWRCRVRGTLFPTRDGQSLVLAAFALSAFLVAFLSALLW
jgi:hypothetical protein